MSNFIWFLFFIYISYYLITFLLEIITLGLLPETICSIISLITCGLLFIPIVLCLIDDLITGIFRFFGKEVDISRHIELSIKERKEKAQKIKKEKYRLDNQSAIEEELNQIKKEYNLIADNSLIEEYKSPNITTYMDNDEKYLYVMEQEKKVKRLFREYEDLFNITERGIFIKKSFYAPDFDGYNEEDIKFLNRIYPIAPQDIEKIIKRRLDCLYSIRESVSKATFEAIKTKKGKDGEDNVANNLELFKDNYIILNNIRVELDGQSSESDFIIICDKGVFAIEVKNHGNANSKIMISQDGRWTMVKNGISEVKDNVSAQNNRHCAINQTILNRELKNRGINREYIKCKSIITIANDKVELSNKSMNIVLRASEIITYIENLNTDIKLDREIQEEIADIFKENNLPPKKYPVVDLTANLKDSLEEYVRLENVLNGYVKLKSTYNKYLK